VAKLSRSIFAPLPRTVDALVRVRLSTTLRFHDLRHTFASHLIVDLGLDVAQVSRILGHASITITLDVYTHLFDDARHSREIRQQMAASNFAALLSRNSHAATVSVLPVGHTNA
jgi:integrase